MERSEVLNKSVRDVFAGSDGSTVPTVDLEKAAAKCYDFQVTGAKLKLVSPLGNPKGGFVLTFRPAARSACASAAAVASSKCPGLSDRTRPV